MAWPTIIHFKRMPSLSLILIVLVLLPGCSATPQSHPRDTAPIPQDAQFLAECSIKGVMACSLTSALSGDYGAEKRPACIAYRDRNWKLVETCGSLPATHP